MSTILHKSIVVDATSEQVFNRWTRNEESTLFFAPECAIELKIGGKYEQYFFLDNEPELRGSEGCKVLSFIPSKMFSFSWNAPPKIPKIRNHKHKAWVVILINEINKNKTKVDLYHLGFLEGKAWDDTIQYFDTAWDYVLESLKKSFD